MLERYFNLVNDLEYLFYFTVFGTSVAITLFDRMNRHLYQAEKRRCLMENAAEGTREYLNWPEGLYPPPPPIDPEEDVCYLSTGVTDEDWKFGSD